MVNVERWAFFHRSSNKSSHQRDKRQRAGERALTVRQAEASRRRQK